MRVIHRLSVRAKLYAGFVVVAAALLVAVGVGWLSMLSVSNTVRGGLDRAVIAEATSKWAYNMRVSQSQSAAIGHGIKNADGSDMHTSDVAAFTHELAKLRARDDRVDDRSSLARIAAIYARWSVLDRRVIALWKGGDKHAAVARANGAANTAGDNLSAALDAFAEQETVVAEHDKAA